MDISLPFPENQCTCDVFSFRLLAVNQAATLPNIPGTPRPLGQRERSLSAPNVNMIGQPGMGQHEMEV